MGENTNIAWTDHSFNPWMGCLKVSAGCEHCYAETLVHDRMGKRLWGPAKTTRRQRTAASTWEQPRKWNRAAAKAGVRRRVFCASLADVFEDHPQANEARPDLWKLIEETPWLDWQLLTKRPENIHAMLPTAWLFSMPTNVWLGTSVEDMRVAERVDILREIPAVVRFISYEPALGPLDELNLTGISWVIYGGESGAERRPDRIEWAEAMAKRCADCHIPFFMKQVSAARPGELPEGCTLPREFPTTHTITVTP